jgi:hypothetical protein
MRFRYFDESRSEWIEAKNPVLFPDRYISINGNEPAPLEDYGDYVLLPDAPKRMRRDAPQDRRLCNRIICLRRIRA